MAARGRPGIVWAAAFAVDNDGRRGGGGANALPDALGLRPFARNPNMDIFLTPSFVSGVEDGTVKVADGFRGNFISGKYCFS